MKYRSISLNGNNNCCYGLLKYSEDHKCYLKELNNMNKELADAVINGPKIWSEASERQSYMIICDNYKLVGAVIIDTSTDGKTLKIELELIEGCFEYKQDMAELIEQLVESLKLFFCDKESIEIHLINNINLSCFKTEKYCKKVYDGSLTTYTCGNKINNVLVPRLAEEMNEAEQCLTSWGQFWWQELDGSELMLDYDRELKKAIDAGTATLPELFAKFKTILWHDINSKNATRSIAFSRNGDVAFNKESRKFGSGANYQFLYNVLTDKFLLTSETTSKNCPGEPEPYIDVHEDPLFTRINKDKVDICHLKVIKKKRIRYVSPIIDSSSVSIELWTNEQNEIEKCYVDFRTHKGNGKINGIYALRVLSRGLKPDISLKFIHRRGYSDLDLSNTLGDYISVFSIERGYKDAFFLNDLVNEALEAINRFAIQLKRQMISSNFDNIIEKLVCAEGEVIDYLKQIKGEIPLPHLRKELEHFIDATYRCEEKGKGRILKAKDFEFFEELL